MVAQFHPSKDILLTPQALWFGDELAPLLGWYHPARQCDLGGSRQCGVVLCPPFGHEYMVSYLSYKHLAIALARAGFDVLFFDYNNSGDSANAEGDRVALWQANILAASRQLRDIAGVQHISLFGLRLGALLAASVVNEVEAAALIMFAPAVSGRAYCRELQLLRNMSALQADTPALNQELTSQVTEDELTGYEFSAVTRSSIAKLDMLKMPVPEIPVLIIARDDVIGQEEKLVAHWGQTNAHVHLSTSPGYATMMPADAYATKVPNELLLDVVAWLTSQFDIHPTQPSIANTVRTSTRMQFNEHTVIEELVTFEGLVGVVSRPEQHNPAQRTAVLLTNIGANHRVGTHQLYVNLARSMAASGFIVLRFDKSGIGYSKANADGKENDVYGTSGLPDMQSAMQFLRNHYDTENFIAGGLCSGAYFCYLTALAEPDIKGLILMNQLVYHWNEGDSLDIRKKQSIKSTHFYVKAIRSLHTWKRLLRGQIEFRKIFVKLSKRVQKRLHIMSQAFVTKFVESHHFLGKIARQFRQMEARGTEILMIMDAGDSSVDLMTENFGRHGVLLGKSPRICLEIFKGSDHTFTPRWAQQHVIKLITTHFSERFEVGSATVEK
ncbi:serine aminopeptidase domain-containing protein [Undibacterium sp. RuRC25W]|uniref:serine aminopeptidase domain-containing protein n=1 Tax=Undibacterium sp. RuRC25W TaxID=3413047 RepID=UPI003BF1E920